MKKLSLLLKILAWLLILPAATSSCDNLDDTRIPPAPVHLVFQSVADWHTWGLGGAVEAKRFILTDTERTPSGYPYTALDRTGFGGLLLAEDVNGTVVVYDLACPVECKANVRVKVDPESLTAECPQCHSTYDVFSLFGHPLSGPAAEKGYGLRRYHALPGTSPYMVISN
ncbi:MAG: hypothetical protein K2M06_07310 [Muribaculaceae bacterium]|nr:hypothetical protein [Muribaculaceae bacterium]